MTSKFLGAGLTLVIALALAGCSSPSGGEGSGCDVVGIGEGADGQGMVEGNDTDGYPLRGGLFVGTAEGDPVADVRLTVSGEGFSTVLCSDAEGRWGAVMPTAPPYAVTLDGVPDGLTVRHPEAQADGSFVVSEQPAYPAVLTIYFEQGGSGGGDLSADAPAESADGSWGGITWPGNVGGYRLVSEDEYAAFKEAFPGGTVCVYLGGQLHGEAAVSDGTSMVRAPQAMALYTTSSRPMVEEGCDSTRTMISVLRTDVENLGLFGQAPADVNGNHCVEVATQMCATLDDRGATWSASDLSSSLPLSDVSDFLQAVRAGR